ncbi:cobalamin biosynthesis protein [Brucellaceae bacterium C25G]
MTALGIGFSNAAEPADVVELARQISSGHQIDAIATLSSKRGSAVIETLEKLFNVPVFYYESVDLEAITARLENPSDMLFKRIGCHGVAEAAALLAADHFSNEEAVLLVAKTVLKNASAALAQ